MNYVPFSPDGLKPSTPGSEVPVIAQANDNAIMDDLAFYGALGWSHTNKIDNGIIVEEIARRGNRWTRCVIAYVAAGPAKGEVLSETYYEGTDGENWYLRSDPAAPNATCTYDYDAAGNWIGENWS